MRACWEMICSGHEITTKNTLVQPTFPISFNRYSFIRIRLLPFVNMKCILCILSLLSSLMPFCSLSLLTLLHRASHPPRFACVRWRQVVVAQNIARSSACDYHAHAHAPPDWWGLLVVLRMRLLNAFVYVIMAASNRTASVFIRIAIIAEKKRVVT